MLPPSTPTSPVSSFHKFFDYIPIISIGSAIAHFAILLFEKFSPKKSLYNAPLNERNIQVISSDSWGHGKRGLLDCVPIAGNIILGIHDLYHKYYGAKPKQELSTSSNSHSASTLSTTGKTDEAFKRKIAQLEEKLKHKEALIQQQNVVIRSHEQTIEKLDNQLIVAKDENKKLNKKVEKIRRKNENLISEKEKLQLLIDNKNDELIGATNIYQTTQDELQKAYANLAEARKALAQEQTFAQQHSSLGSAEDLEKLNQDLHRQQQLVEELERKANSIRQNLENAEKEKNDLIQQLQRTQESLQRKEAILEAATRASQLAHESLASAQETVESVQIENGKLKHQVINLTSHLKAREQENLELQQRIDELELNKQEAIDLRKKLASQESFVATFLKEEQQIREDLTSKLSQAQETIREYVFQVEQLQMKCEGLKSKYQTLKDEPPLKQELEAVERKLAEITVQRDHLLEQIEFIKFAQTLPSLDRSLSLSRSMHPEDDISHDNISQVTDSGEMTEWTLIAEKEKTEDEGVTFAGKFSSRYKRENIDTYIQHVLTAGNHAADDLAKRIQEILNYEIPPPLLSELILKFNEQIRKKALLIHERLGINSGNIEQFIKPNDPIVEKGKRLAKEYENEIMSALQDACRQAAEKWPQYKKDLLSLTDECFKIYQTAYFQGVVHFNHWWREVYDKTINFSKEELGAAQVQLKAVGEPYSSAAPRNRQDTLNPAVPNFFRTTYLPYLSSPTSDMKAIKMDNVTRSAIPVEFDQTNKEIREQINRQIVKKILEEHALEYLKKHSGQASGEIPIKLDFAAVTLLSPSSVLDWANYFGKLANADNEAMLLKEAKEAYEYWHRKPLVIKGQEFQFQITYMNIPCNDLYFKSLEWSTQAYALEWEANQIAIKHLAQKVVEYELAVKKEIEENNTSPDLKSKMMKVKILQNLLKDVEAILNIPEGKKLEAFGNNYYALVSRVLMLTSLVSDGVHFGCRSGKDRTGLANLEVDKLLQLTHALEGYPSLEAEVNEPKIRAMAKEIGHQLYIDSGNLDVIPEANLGCPLGMNIGACANPGDKEAKEYALAGAKAFVRPGH
ncbi:hypothetical protein DB42_BK00150 [Neochlamydia sp. EPS4]|uniref:hypothetical protein n=1 Tax=Neochlamydia sp. EPS4 TaxID=1478175 RepID=UPI000583B046|nr:hypothetical protein [Neochlamydia sp. EPS4]KIC74200.1 hypothetical protein DB42_BK00150 [Neochlamydia sp. EPS4]